MNYENINQDFEHNRENCHFIKRWEEVHNGKYSYKIPREYEDPIGGYLLGVPMGGLIGILGDLAYSYFTGERSDMGEVLGFISGMSLGGIVGRTWVAYNNMMYKKEREYMFKQIRARKDHEIVESERQDQIRHGQIKDRIEVLKQKLTLEGKIRKKDSK